MTETTGHAPNDAELPQAAADDPALLLAVQEALGAPKPFMTTEQLALAQGLLNDTTFITGRRQPREGMPPSARAHPQQHTPAIDGLANAHAHPLGRLAAATATIRDREPLYGSPREGMQRAAELASLKLSRTITARDVAVILGCVKEARLAVAPLHRDSANDLVAYNAIAAALQDEG